MYLWARIRPLCPLNLSGSTYRHSSIHLYSDQPNHTDMNKQDMTSKKVIPVNETDFDSAVLRSDVPVFVDFYADWCGPCNMIAPTIEALSEEYDGKVKFVKVHVERSINLELEQKAVLATGGLREKNRP